MDKELKVATKQIVYDTHVLSILLYGCDYWSPLKMHLRKLNTFHHICSRTALGISNQEQCKKHITMIEVRRRWGDSDTAADKMFKGRLQWFGHLA